MARPMTDGERQAFAAGYRLGVEHAVDAHDDLLALASHHVALCEWCADGEPERVALAARKDRRVWVAVARIRRLRERGAEDVLALHDLEHAMVAER